MPKIARLGDRVTGTCSVEGHGNQEGVITSASEDVFADGVAVARVGDTVRANCGHVGVISGGNATVKANGREVARVGDSFSGTFTGVISDGSLTVDS